MKLPFSVTGSVKLVEVSSLLLGSTNCSLTSSLLFSCFTSSIETVSISFSTGSAIFELIKFSISLLYSFNFSKETS